MKTDNTGKYSWAQLFKTVTPLTRFYKHTVSKTEPIFHYKNVRISAGPHS